MSKEADDRGNVKVGQVLAFDRTAPDEGVETRLQLETGRAYFEWQLRYTGTPRAETLHLWLRDGRQETVLECLGMAAEEEPLRAILLQPHLWNGVRDPYLYTLEVTLWDEKGTCTDRICRPIPLRRAGLQSGKGFVLNSAPFDLRTVQYRMPAQAQTAAGQRIIMEDLQKLLSLGANSVYIEQGEGLTKPFLQLCDRMGIFILTDMSCLPYNEKMENQGGMPVLRGGAGSLIHGSSGSLTSEFYRYKARWNPEPFVYIVPESVKRRENGSFCATVYSSCSRIALYSDGRLFEFMSGQESFVFQDIPAKGPCVTLTAEGDGCSGAFSVHKTFTKSSRNGDISFIQ